MMYEVIYLPLALNDLREITDYLTINLKSSEAALDFISALEESVSKLVVFPYSRRVYHPIKELKHEYRLWPVKNYALFYTVDGQVVEIHRVIYAKRDLSQFISHDSLEDS